MKKCNTLSILGALIALISFSCSKGGSDSPNEEASAGTGKTKYIIAASTEAKGVADYLLTVDDITKGSVTTQGNGLEQDGTYRYYITNQNRFFSLLYGQGGPGAVTTYSLTPDGKLTKLSNFQAETVQIAVAVDKDILTIKVPRSGTSVANMYRIDATTSKIVGEATQDIVKLAKNGERAHYTRAMQVGNKVYIPYMSIKGDGIDTFGTKYPDSTWVAIYSYPELKLEKVIKDNRTSYLGAYAMNALIQDEKGDVYGFSGAIATNNSVMTSTKPSAVVKIKKGTTEFDQSYFFNVEEKSGGYKIYSSNYIGNGKVLLGVFANKGTNKAPYKLAIADVYAQTFMWVTNVPEKFNTSTATSFNVYNNNIIIGGGNSLIVGINAPEGNWIYTIDGTTGVATKGMKVEGGEITSISELKY